MHLHCLTLPLHHFLTLALSLSHSHLPQSCTPSLLPISTPHTAKNGVVLAVEKKQKSVLYDESSINKVMGGGREGGREEGGWLGGWVGG